MACNRSHRANLARHIASNIKAWPKDIVYHSDGTHPLAGPHKALGKLLYASLAPLLDPATRSDAGMASTRGSTSPAARRAFSPTGIDVAFRCGLPPLYHWLARAQSMEAVSADQPTLNIPARWFTRLDPKFKAAPTRNDRIVQVPFRPCPHKLTYAFNKRTNATRVLLGFGMQGSNPDLSGLALLGSTAAATASVTCINVDTAPWCHTCGHSRDFDVWRLCHVPAMPNPNATVAFCGAGYLRFMTFIELAENHGAHHAVHHAVHQGKHNDVARCRHEQRRIMRGQGGCGGQPYLQHMKGTFDECADVCHRNLDCVKFQRDVASGTCYMAGKDSAAQAVEPNGQSGWECGLMGNLAMQDGGRNQHAYMNER